MMKNAFFVIGVISMCCCNTGFAQSESDIATSLKVLQTPSSFSYPIDNTEFLKVTDPKFYLENGEPFVFPLDHKNIHFVDLNTDGRKDVIYQDTRRYNATILFINKDNSFTQSWVGVGALVEVIQEKEQTTLYVRNPPIGCFDNTQLLKVVIDANFSISETIMSYHSNTIIENLDTGFKQQKISGILRTLPVADDALIKDPCTGEEKRGNQVRVIENQLVTIIKEQGDWLLVVYEAKGTSIICWTKNPNS